MRKPASPSSIPSADSVFQIAANTSVIRLRSVTNL
jgi:phosphopentomutase